MRAVRPSYHLTAPANWLSDPNGPIYWNGRYHLFYQHNVAAPTWGLMCWGHAVSDDLLHWSDRGVALRPTAGSADADGCWSGCARVIDGRPVFYYTGAAGTGSDHTQTVLRAVGDAELDQLWAEPAGPVVAPSVAALGTKQQRDPFLLRHGDRWMMLLGTGLRTDHPAGCGAVVAWESDDTLHWSYRGVVFARPGGTDPDGAGIDTGPVWECPQLVRVDGAWVLIVSVQMPGTPDPRCPYAVWFVGDFDGKRFEPTSMGLVDAGEVYYAPAVTEAVVGRTLLWGWLQDGRPATDARFAGAMSLPRELSVRGGRLLSRPAAEVERLWTAPPLAGHEDLEVDSARPARIAGPLAPAYRLQFEVEASGRAGACLGRDEDGNTIWVGILSGPPRLAAGVWRDGELVERYSAPISVSGAPVRVTAHVDASIIEVFADGCALTLRVHPGLRCSAGVWLEAQAGTARFRRVVLSAASA